MSEWRVPEKMLLFEQREKDSGVSYKGRLGGALDTKPYALASAVSTAQQERVLFFSHFRSMYYITAVWWISMPIIIACINIEKLLNLLSCY